MTSTPMLQLDHGHGFYADKPERKRSGISIDIVSAHGPGMEKDGGTIVATVFSSLCYSDAQAKALAATFVRALLAKLGKVS